MKQRTRRRAVARRYSGISNASISRWFAWRAPALVASITKRLLDRLATRIWEAHFAAQHRILDAFDNALTEAGRQILAAQAGVAQGHPGVGPAHDAADLNV